MKKMSLTAIREGDIEEGFTVLFFQSVFDIHSLMQNSNYFNF